jgi:hypothetical protein
LRAVLQLVVFMPPPPDVVDNSEPIPMLVALKFAVLSVAAIEVSVPKKPVVFHSTRTAALTPVSVTAARPMIVSSFFIVFCFCFAALSIGEIG